MDSIETITRLCEMARKIMPIDGKAAKRLEQLADLLGKPDADKLATIDLYGAISTRSITESAFQFFCRRPRWLKWLAYLRDVLVFAPICLTWIGLWQAALHYETLLTVRPDLANTPFLLLWVQGFAEAGGGTWFTFSHVAMYDFYLIAAVLVLTAVVQLYRDVKQRYAERDAQDLRKELEDILWQVEKTLAEKRHAQNAAILQFETSAKVLVKHLTSEGNRLVKLANRREKELGDLTALGESLTTGADTLQKFSRTVRGVYDPLQESVQKLAAHAGTIEQHEAHLVDTIDTFNQRLSQATASVVDTGQSLQAASGGMADAANRIATFAEVSNANLTRFDGITDSLGKATANAADMAGAMNATMALVNRAGEDLIPVLETLSQENAQLAQVVSTLSRAGQSIGSAADGLTDSVGHFSTFAATSTASLQNVSGGLDTLTDRLGTITGNLHKASSEAKSFSRDASEIAASLNRAEQTLVPILTVYLQETKRIIQQSLQAVPSHECPDAGGELDQFPF